MDNNVTFSLLILKPDADIEVRNLLPFLIGQFNLRIIHSQKITFDLETLKQFYQWTKIDFPSIIEEYLCRLPMDILLIEGVGAISKVMEIKEILRKKFQKDILHTVIHCPDTELDYVRELNLLFFKKLLMEENMKTNNQVEVIIFRKEGKIYKFLMLKRIPEKGGFWQPITGNVRVGETFETAALRETGEEIGVKDIIRVFDTKYSFDFFDDGREQHEKVFALEVSPEIEIHLSREHTEFAWADKDQALNKYLKYPGNKKGLVTLCEILDREVSIE